MGRARDVLTADGFVLPGELSRKVAALDREFYDMNTEIQALKTQKLHLEAQINPLEREVKRLKEQFENGGQESRIPSFTQDEEKILKSICHAEKSMWAGEIAEATGLTQIRVEAFLIRLEKSGLIWKSLHWQGGIMFVLSDDGKTFALEHGWI